MTTQHASHSHLLLCRFAIFAQRACSISHAAGIRPLSTTHLSLRAPFDHAWLLLQPHAGRPSLGCHIDCLHLTPTPPRLCSDNNERLAELHASSEMLVSKLEEVRIQLVGGGSPSAVSSEADEPDCPDWVDALGDGGSGGDTWIDEGSPQSPYAEKAASQHEASYRYTNFVPGIAGVANSLSPCLSLPPSLPPSLHHSSPFPPVHHSSTLVK